MTVMAAYRRVSTPGQEYGLSAQIAEIEAEAVRREWTLLWFEDRASGRSTDGRPGLQAALATVRAGKCAGVVVSKLDRLTRSTRDFIELWDEATASGWSLIALNGPESPLGSPYVWFSMVLLAASAELEAILLSERTKGALAAARRKGIRPGPASTLPNEITRRIGFLRSQGASYGAIAAQLTEEGIPTPAGYGTWHATQVRRRARDFELDNAKETL